MTCMYVAGVDRSVIVDGLLGRPHDQVASIHSPRGPYIDRPQHPAIVPPSSIHLFGSPLTAFVPSHPWPEHVPSTHT